MEEVSFMKKILLIVFIALSIFIKNVNAATQFLETSCVAGTNNELNEFVKSSIDRMNLKTGQKYEYITYCILKSYDYKTEYTTNVDYAQGCFFNSNDDLSSTVSINCSLYFTIKVTPDKNFYFNLSGNGSNFRTSFSYKEMLFSIKKEENKTGDLVGPIEQPKNNNVEIAILMILIVFLFIFSICKMVGV